MAASRPRRAVTLIEAVLFIAVALTLIVGGLVFYRQASIAYQTQQTVRLVSALVAEARALLRQSDIVDTVDFGEILHAAGAVPPTAWDETTRTLRTPWGKEMFLMGRSGWSGLPGYGVDVGFMDWGQMDPIPPEICARLVMYDGATGTGVLGDGIAFVEMTGVPGYGGILWAPSDRYVAAYPAAAVSGGAYDVPGGLDPATAGDACHRLDSHAVGYRLMISFWFEH
jgi:hypothetical protein